MPYLAAYVTALIVFGGIDALWLSFMGPAVYRPELADILAPNLRLAPAIAFYLAFPIGLVVFGVLPGMRSGALTSTFAFALLFGALAYATYDFTMLCVHAFRRSSGRRYRESLPPDARSFQRRRGRGVTTLRTVNEV
jgi:uncharacterized membrane protein